MVTVHQSDDVREQLSRRLAELEPQSWVVRIETTDGPSFVVDCRDARVSDVNGDPQVDCTITMPSDVLERFVRRDADLRYVMIYNGVRVQGPMGTAVHFTDWLVGASFTPVLDVPVSSLPTPTTDRSVAKRDLAEFGYAIVEGALDPERLAVVRGRVADQAVAEAQAGCAGYQGYGRRGEPSPNQAVWSIINKGEVFMDLLDHPLIDDFVFPALGADCCLSGYWAVIVDHERDARLETPLHHDQMGITPPIPVSVGLNLAWCLDDFTEENGATRLVPGSHLPENMVAPDDPFTQDDTVAAVAPAGSLVLFDSRLWHAPGRNRTERKRHALFMYFTREWMRTVENPYLSTLPSVTEAMSDRLKTMFGLKHTRNLGRVGASRMGEFVHYAPDELVGEMHPTVA